MTNNEWYSIVNPRAGSGKTMSKWVPAEKLLKELGVEIRTVYTTHKYHAVELAYNAAEHGYRKIMAVGGDGSIHEVFEGVLSWCEKNGADPSEFYLALAPIGSGNDWIKSFGIPKNTKDMARLLAKAQTDSQYYTTEDVVKVSLADGNSTFMANIGGIVFDSHVCDRVNQSKEQGKRKARIYLRALLKSLFEIKPIDVTIYCDENLVYTGSVLDIAFGNGSYCGGGMQQCCLAQPSDGILDAIVVPNIPVHKLLSEIPRMYNKSLHESKKIIYLRGKCFRVEPLNKESEDIVEIDGEIVGRLPVKIELLSHKINVLSNK